MHLKADSQAAPAQHMARYEFLDQWEQNQAHEGASK
jgi:hypothetical protein